MLNKIFTKISFGRLRKLKKPALFLNYCTKNHEKTFKYTLSSSLLLLTGYSIYKSDGLNLLVSFSKPTFAYSDAETEEYFESNFYEPYNVKERNNSKRNGIVMSQFSIANAVDIACPALVNIQIKVTGGFGQTGLATGSGFIFNSDKFLVATNHHVIRSAGNKSLLVTLSSGEQFRGKVHSSDPLTDIAIVQLDERVEGENFIKLNFSSKYKIPEVKLGNASDLRVGEWIIALGSPLGMQNTVTSGIISSLNRSLSDLGLSQRRTDYIQTDAAINEGNSGGPLINLQGEVIGMNTLKLANHGGISFAIPIDTLKIVLHQLEHKKKVDRPYLGLKMISVSKIQNGKVGETGVIVANVRKNSPAQKGGIEKGDFILTVDDEPIKSNFDLIKIIGYEVGKTHKIKVKKDNGRIKTYNVTTVLATF